MQAPIFEETIESASSATISEMAGLVPGGPRTPGDFEAIVGNTATRRLSVYPPSAVFQLTDEMEFLAARSVEANVFFNPNFLAPAIPRLEDREIRLAILRDEYGDASSGYRSRMRLALPYSVERVGLGLGPQVIRAWSNDFGPQGTPLLDNDDPYGVIDEFLSILALPHLDLPKALVLPNVYDEGPTTGLIRAAAISQGFPVASVNRVPRAVLDSRQTGDHYLRDAFSSHHRRNFGRLWRQLARGNTLEFKVTRERSAIFDRVEEFLALEASGWKGRKRTAMISDRLQAAFAREALDRLAARDRLRVYSLDLNGRAIASLLVLIETGVAYTWKIAYDERYHMYSPGMLLLIETTKQNLKDPNIVWSDSCAGPNHPMMDRVWKERRHLSTLIIGLGTSTQGIVEQVARDLTLFERGRMVAKSLRSHWRSTARSLGLND